MSRNKQKIVKIFRKVSSGKGRASPKELSRLCDKANGIITDPNRSDLKKK